jgi:hypothetical protein
MSGQMLDPSHGELTDAPVQREAGKLRLGRVRRKDFYLPAAQVLGPPNQFQADFHVLCRGLVIVVEQVENQSPAVGLLRHSRTATTTDVYMQELPEGVAATVNAINIELRKEPKKAQQKKLSKNLLPNAYQIRIYE